VDAAWVAAHRADSGLVILECQWGSALPGSDYALGHVPGAIHIDTDDFELGPPAYFLKPATALRETVERLGITSETCVVVYSSWSIAAARCWWILRYLGVEDVRFFDGGYAAWIAAGGSAEVAPNAPGPRCSFGRDVPARPDWLVGTAEMEEIVARASSDTRIVDVRSQAEFLGQTSGYRSLEARGRLPGALWGRDACGEPGSTYLRPDGTLRASSEIQELWTSLDITPDREIVFYCGGGWRSSLAFLYAQLLGFPRVRHYADGWFAWNAGPGATSG
jgi:thiosulfate/3-mercaptopyruvate sulfurtransferase